jgi:DNA mismatch repair ATPase MutS
MSCYKFLTEFNNFLDVTSWENLELFNRRPAKKNANWRCLYERMNTCVTNGGSRTLRSCLLQPSADVNEINDRLDLVEEFMKNQAVNFFFHLFSILV